MLMFHALADPTRRAITELLARSAPMPASVIAAQFALTPSAISQHLKLLREAGLVQVEQKAQQRIYRIDPAPLEELERWLARTRWFMAQRQDA